ncbi:MAG: hypothetical protein QOK09_1252, partial [Mycobacterium sp.]|nr:hypothetical protein [Mycobacterium sp.]
AIANATATSSGAAMLICSFITSPVMALRIWLNSANWRCGARRSFGARWWVLSGPVTGWTAGPAALADVRRSLRAGRLSIRRWGNRRTGGSDWRLTKAVLFPHRMVETCLSIKVTQRRLEFRVVRRGR